ncbi:MAG: hypothetical protein ABIK98_10315 [Pseudomonadota bacterium]|uniref:Uncharacterized protein n=1 Tax=Candidatus Desulfatibia profunda TaxID=2841695 RepID=A0A8J6TNB6_9BACT|nr:hypothetical protein [Candidatus Desulfatibia profunda]MBL7181358.1 hypothetical protein [Desulfobacterales bacterium]
MQKRNLKLIIAGILILTFLGGVNTAHSILAVRDYNIIRIAFMNGYIEALKLSTEEKKKLENDKTLLAKTVESAAEGYLTRVENLNH